MATKVKKEVEISAKDLASQTLGSISYKFKKFEAALKRVQSAAGNVGRSMRGIATTFGGAATAAAAAINKMATKADDLNTMANIVGMNIEAYQKLRYAAEQNDVSTEAFDKSLQMLSKSMGELNKGQGTLYSRLKKTNPVLLKQLRAAKGNEEAFRLMMDAINKSKTAQQRAYLATAAFGKSGQQLISLGLAGADAMKKFEDEAERFGLVSSDGGAAADEWGRGVVRLRMALQGVGNTILNKVLPSLIPMLNSWAEWIADNRELIATRVVEFGERLVKVLERIGACMMPLLDLFSRCSWLVDVLFYTKVAGAIVNIIQLGNAIVNVIPALWGFASALLANPITWIVAGVIALVAAIYLLWKNWDKINAKINEFLESHPKLKKWFEQVKKWAQLAIWPFKALYNVIDAIVKAIQWVGRKLGILPNELTVEQKNNANQWLAENGVTPKYSPNANMSPVNPGLQMSPLGQSQTQLMTMGGRQSADINVRFDNLPAMTRIDTQSSDTNLDLEIYRGVNGGTIQ